MLVKSQSKIWMADIN